MFSRMLSMTLKPNAGQEFTNVLATTILPILRAQPGFRDEMLFVKSGGPEVLAVSIWDSKEDADKYSRATYPDVLSALTHLIERPPRVESYVLAFSTAHGLALGQTPVQSPNITPIAGVGG